jgi:hypothetical protein
MSFVVRELPNARQDKVSIFRWLDERSPTGALAWLDSYDSLLDHLKEDTATFGLALEAADCEFEIRQALFKTRRGRVYRALFFIEGGEVFIARVRGPGQAPVMPPEIK